MRDNTLKLFKSYFDNRTQYVQIDTNTSIPLYSQACSIIQGSKLSGLLYTLYTNKIPLLEKIIGDKNIYNKVTKFRIKGIFDNSIFGGIKHNVLNYIDDSTNIISAKQIKILKVYLFQYYILVENFYHCNKLKIINDPTVLMCVSNKNMR